MAAAATELRFLNLLLRCCPGPPTTGVRVNPHHRPFDVMRKMVLTSAARVFYTFTRPYPGLEMQPLLSPGALVVCCLCSRLSFHDVNGIDIYSVYTSQSGRTYTESPPPTHTLR